MYYVHERLRLLFILAISSSNVRRQRANGRLTALRRQRHRAFSGNVLVVALLKTRENRRLKTPRLLNIDPIPHIRIHR